MRLAKIICIILAVALVVCLPLTAYAKPPTKATIYASIYEGDTTNAFRPLNIVPINNMTFGVYTDGTIYNTCTYLRLYFRFDVESFTSFHFRIKRLTDTITDASTSLTSLAIDVCKLDANNVTKAYDHIQNDVYATKSVVDGYSVYEWTYTAGTPIADRNAVMVYIPFQTFMLGESPIYFETLAIEANGMSIEEIEINRYGKQFQERLERLEDIEERAYQQGQDIPIADIQDYLSRTDGDHYFSAFHYMFAQSTLLSTMVTVVCLFGIIGFIIYGKKV